LSVYSLFILFFLFLACFPGDERRDGIDSEHGERRQPQYGFVCGQVGSNYTSEERSDFFFKERTEFISTVEESCLNTNKKTFWSSPFFSF
jgi:hypothetical protein